jgi:maltooligosyltrehalose trehalohydrolase
VDPSLPGWRFVASLQNHDQVGNRAVGDRLSATLDPGLLACGAALLLTAPWTPMLFMGEEWGATTPWQYFTDHSDPGLGEAVREGRRAEFASHGWQREQVPDPQSPETFAASCLDWSEPAREPHARLLAWYRDLVRLRRATTDLNDGRLDRVAVERDAAAGTLVLRRGAHQVAVNLAAEPRDVGVTGTVLLSWEPVAGPADGAVLVLPGRSAAVVRA